jgi:hypothetical protein
MILAGRQGNIHFDPVWLQVLEKVEELRHGNGQAVGGIRREQWQG